MKYFFNAVVGIAFMLNFVSAAGSDSCNALSNDDKLDCAATDFSVNKSSCEAKGCCWLEVDDGGKTPWCYYTSTLSTPGYALSGMTETTTGYSGNNNV